MVLKCLALDRNHPYCVIFDLLSDIISFKKCPREIFPSENLFTLVSNMQISRFNLILYNYRNWSASSTLISPTDIIFSRDLTCSNVVCLYYCIVLTCCSLGPLYGSKLGTYDIIVLVSPEGSTEGTTREKL